MPPGYVTSTVTATPAAPVVPRVTSAYLEPAGRAILGGTSRTQAATVNASRGIGTKDRTAATHARRYKSKARAPAVR